MTGGEIIVAAVEQFGQLLTGIVLFGLILAAVDLLFDSV